MSRLPEVLASTLGLHASDFRRKETAEFDLVLSVTEWTFAVHVTSAAVAGKIAAWADRLEKAARSLRRRHVVPLLAVPFMTEAARTACAEVGLSWIDLSGNARIVAPGLRIIVDGRPNDFVKRGRPSSAFAPKSARVVRWLLMHPGRAFSQRDIALATDMSEGFVSRIVARLEKDGYLVRGPIEEPLKGRYGAPSRHGGGFGFGTAYGYGDPSGSGYGSPDAEEPLPNPPHDPPRMTSKTQVRARDPRILLDAWHEVYQFRKHTILEGHIASRSGEALTHEIAERLTAARCSHAVTGLSAAWQWTRFASFRLATFFVEEEPPKVVLDALGFRPESRGANIWFVIPDDAGVFHGAQVRQGVRTVHPVQAYLDLKAHPERSAEAAEHLRTELIEPREDT